MDSMEKSKTGFVIFYGLKPRFIEKKKVDNIFYFNQIRVNNWLSISIFEWKYDY